MYTNNNAYNTGVAGAQTTFEFNLFDNQTATTTDNDLNRIMNQASNYQQQVSVGGVTYPVTGLAPNTQKVYIEQATVKLMLTNQEDTNVEIFIYESVSKMDHSVGAAGGWEGGLGDEQDNTYAGGGFRRNVVGVSPFSSEQFVTYWKCIKKTRIVLGQGQSHCHYINFKPRRVFSAEKLVNADYFLRGLSYNVMVTQAGLPLHDTTNNRATTAPTAIAAVWTKQLKFKTLNQNQTVYTLLTNALTNPVAMQEMDIARGTAQAPAAA